MKILLVLHLVLFSSLAFACDETCMRDKAMVEKNVRYPEYLTAQYCRTTKIDFLVNARKSLQQYREQRLATGHRGGIRNIRNFIEQRREWLMECDAYLDAVKQGRIFQNKATTDDIFASITSLSTELNSLVFRPRNAAENTSEITASAAQKFDLMFQLLDNHRTDLQLRGLL